jgi:uncharacterized membrane protein
MYRSKKCADQTIGNGCASIFLVEMNIHHVIITTHEGYHVHSTYSTVFLRRLLMQPNLSPPLAAAETIAPWRHALSRRIVRAGNLAADWIMVHWLGIINWSLGFILGGAFLAPLLAYFGVEPQASSLLRMYHSTCDQIPSHSVFICGHQVGLCSRCLALYGSIWLGSIAFRFLRGHIKPIPWYILIFFLLPMALDGGTQLFGWRESNLFLRLLTGALFGIGGSWFAFPFVQEAIDETPLSSSRQSYGLPNHHGGE